MRRLVLAALAVLALARPAAAEFPDRNIDMIVPYGPGGGFDIYARAVGRVMEKHMTNGMKVLVHNVPGAGSRLGTAQLYRAPPDGYTMGIVDLPGASIPAILGEHLNYDLDKFTWLGVVNVGVYSIVVAGNSPFKTYDDLAHAGHQVFFATTGSNDYGMARIAVATLKLDARFITGYTGAPEALLAVSRGEATAGLGIDVTVASRIASGDLRRLAVLRQGAPGPADDNVATATGLGHPELANLHLSRVFAAPPGLSPAVRQGLTTLVEQSIEDPELAAWSKSSNYPLTPGTAEDARHIYQEQRDFMAKYRDLLK